MKKYKEIPRSVWTNPIHFIACGFGIGALPIMPGTYGTLFGVLVYLVIQQFSLATYIIIILLMNLIGVVICQITNRDFKTDDHPAAVWDEIATFPIVMIAIPFTWYYLVLGFLLFRLLDILKPGPIGWIDRNVHGGIGVMLDDILAALVSWGILQFIVWIIN